jgi:predicted O-methyltransferase YrrM
MEIILKAQQDPEKVPEPSKKQLLVNEKISRINSIMYQSRLVSEGTFSGPEVEWDLSQYTDKDTEHSYFIPYIEILNKIKYISRPNMVEVGTAAGGGLLFWKELLNPNLLCGIDIEYHIVGKIGNLLFDSEPSSVVTIIDDAYTERTIERLKVLFPDGIDIVSEDGDHSAATQIRCIELYYPLVKEGGVIMIEDVRCPGSDILDYLDERVYDYEVFDMRPVKDKYDNILVAVYA